MCTYKQKKYNFQFRSFERGKIKRKTATKWCSNLVLKYRMKTIGSPPSNGMLVCLLMGQGNKSHQMRKMAKFVLHRWMDFSYSALILPKLKLKWSFWMLHSQVRIGLRACTAPGLLTTHHTHPLLGGKMLSDNAPKMKKAASHSFKNLVLLAKHIDLRD